MSNPNTISRQLRNLRLLKGAFMSLADTIFPAGQDGTTTLLTLLRTNKAGFKAAGLEASRTPRYYRFNHRKDTGSPATVVARWTGAGFDKIEPLFWIDKTTTGKRLAARVETLIRKFEAVLV